MKTRKKNIGYFNGLPWPDTPLDQARWLHRRTESAHRRRDIADPGHQFIMGIADELLVLERM